VGLCLSTQSFAYKISSLNAAYRNGQVFLTWTNPEGTNLKYRVYRSTSPITVGTQLNSAQLLGYVLDNSGKNIRKSALKNQATYYKIEEAGSPLASNQGLYVVTCTDNQTWYYAVTVENVSTGSEVRNITPGKNSLQTGIQEAVSPIQPVLQNTVHKTTGDDTYEYVVFGSNQSSDHLPAFNNCGSYGYNFSFIDHASGEVPLYVLFRDSDPFSHITPPEQCGEANTLLMDDWLPNGENTYWFGYNEAYNMYSSSNPVFTTGTVRGYTQARVKWTMQWVINNYGVDASRVYCSGFSHNGFGAMLTGMMHPEMIAAEWGNVIPILVKALKGSTREKMWCANTSNLPTDVMDPQTGLPINIWTLFDLRQMLRINKFRGVPFLGGVHGKNDITVGWVQYFSWYDSVEISNQGGLWFWDQRNHNGAGKNFTSTEASINYGRFSTLKSYPAFSYCSINQDPGNSNTATGDPYGALNGYLDWNDASVIDENCEYSITCLIKDFYVNGVKQQAFESCVADVTPHRIQNFHPAIGTFLDWEVREVNGNIIQSGSFIYDGNPITLPAVTILRDGSVISIRKQSCFEKLLQEELDETHDWNVELTRSNASYRLIIHSDAAGNASIRLFDVAGKTISATVKEVNEGRNEWEVVADRGICLLHIRMNGNLFTRKIYFD
jgi:hypothetical protein